MLSRFRTAQKVSARFLHEAASLKPSDSRAASFEKGQRVHGFIVENVRQSRLGIGQEIDLVRRGSRTSIESHSTIA